MRSLARLRPTCSEAPSTTLLEPVVLAAGVAERCGGQDRASRRRTAGLNTHVVGQFAATTRYIDSAA